MLHPFSLAYRICSRISALTERDEFIYDEMITHVPMAVHPGIRDILVIGAGDGGVVRELTRYDRVEHIDLVEMDPLVVEACRTYLRCIAPASSA